MGAQTPHKIPVVDFSIENMKPGTSTWYSARKDVQRAFEECGCFVAVYDKVPLQLHNTMFAKVEELFYLPKDTKIKNTSDKPYYGYYGQISFLPLYECLGIDNPLNLEGVQNFTNLMWPAGNELFWYNFVLVPQLFNFVTYTNLLVFLFLYILFGPVKVLICLQS